MTNGDLPNSAVGTYRGFARFYDAYVGGFDDDLPLYLSLCRGRDRILEIGCGTGRVLEALLRAGHDVIGVDISPEMLEEAGRKLARYVDSGRLTLTNHDFRLLPFPGSFDCVLVTFFTFNYLLDDAEQPAFLDHVSSAMPNGGVIALDLFYPRCKSEATVDNRWEYRDLQVGGETVHLKSRRRMVGDLEERIQLFTQHGHVEEILTLRRYIDKRKMLVLLSNAGFTDVRFADDYDPSHLYELSKEEETTSSFVVTASRLAQN